MTWWGVGSWAVTRQPAGAHRQLVVGPDVAAFEAGRDDGPRGAGDLNTTVPLLARFDRPTGGVLPLNVGSSDRHPGRCRICDRRFSPGTRFTSIELLQRRPVSRPPLRLFDKSELRIVDGY